MAENLDHAKTLAVHPQHQALQGRTPIEAAVHTDRNIQTELKDRKGHTEQSIPTDHTGQAGQKAADHHSAADPKDRKGRTDQAGRSIPTDRTGQSIPTDRTGQAGQKAADHHSAADPVPERITGERTIRLDSAASPMKE